MAKDYRIGALWMEGPLSFLEQLCLVSFRDAGHHVTLYHYGDVQNVPEGIELADANTVLSRDNEFTHARTGSPALHSDLFRYKMLEQQDDVIWADTDAYCVRKFETPNGHFYGWESERHINGGVLGLPQDSETLRELLAFTDEEYPIPEWYAEDEKDRLRALAEAGTPVHAGELAWGVWGPHAVTHFLHKTGEVKYALPRHALYPFLFKDRRLMLRRGLDASEYIKDDTYSVHFYGRRMRKRIVEKEGGIPKRYSLIGKLLHQHGIDPLAAPIPVAPGDAAPQATAGAKGKTASRTSSGAVAAATPLAPADRYGRGLLNLTDLADKYGSDKGSAKHRYTELYHMLFQPFRHRSITFMEMGLLIGGPEHGKSADRATNDLPSIRMWMEYFTKAQIIGLDVSDFSWFEDERFRFLRCDMDERANIVAATREVDSFDIILDDASHASHHQQFAFMELFPKLKSGGLYVIEDLRWQPEPYERPGITKTAEMFRGYQDTGVFTHSDPQIAAEMNALRADISGCFVFPVHFRREGKDQVAVIHKR